ncbi:DUF2827 family protein [uncultured Veillonella sp.]|uniref:DUF2827 family protein n=1 Tax=uncultured Veillonella sp. TaxID=159268 RepID=UPI0025FC2E35|nr:DUF2827 family protein [uncultured Veillonella sp.]MDY3974394.1 DUF2827 family protein [Veillonella caviae]
MKNKIRIGITYFWGSQYKNLWSNGAGQNMYFLKETLMQIPFVEDVYFVYWGNDASSVPRNLGLDVMNVKLYSYEDVLTTTDVLIEGTLALTPELERLFRNHGTKIISFRMGNDFIWDLEKFINHKDGGRAFNGATYDAVWLIPQIVKTNLPYVKIMTHSEVREVPHLWDPTFMQWGIKQLPREYRFGYKAKRALGQRRISVFEPNTSVVKNVYVPILIAEALYKNEKTAISHVYLCNTFNQRNVSGFHNFIGYTQLVKDNVMTVEARYPMPYFLSKYTDIVLSFQWELGLNYAYYEALYGDYPLVHNSPFLEQANVGFYYPEFDAFKGADALREAIYHYDDHIKEHRRNNARFLESLSPYNDDVVKAYSEALRSIW